MILMLSGFVNKRRWVSTSFRHKTLLAKSDWLRRSKWTFEKCFQVQGPKKWRLTFEAPSAHMTCL